jgi:hypothetical protein
MTLTRNLIHKYKEIKTIGKTPTILAVASSNHAHTVLCDLINEFCILKYFFTQNSLYLVKCLT